MDKFSKRDTAIIKGIAVLMLVCHHFFNGTLPAPIDWANNGLWVVFATLSKICVAIFVILSGYGLSESYKKHTGTDIAFVGKHLLKLMKQFWFIFILFVPFGFVCARNPVSIYGNGLTGFGNFILDFFGLHALFGTPTMNFTWWYMEACIVMYLLFPILKKLMKRFYILVFVLTAIPVIKFGLNTDTMHGCREIYWLLPFAVGMFLSDKNLLNKMSKALSTHVVSGSIVAVLAALIMTAVRSYYGIIVDTFYALTIIAASKAVVSRIKYINSLMAYLGNHSANIFMFHSFIYGYYEPPRQMFAIIGSSTVNYVLLMIICSAISDYIEILKKRLSSLFIKKPHNKNITPIQQEHTISH